MENKNLTQGSIFSSLIKLALPIMATSYIQMAYNLTDLIWIGRVGSSAVASVGTAGFFSWLGFALITLSKIGGQVGVAQSVGKNDKMGILLYARNALQLNMILALIYAILLIIFRKSLIGFFNLGDTVVINDAISYLTIIASGILFMFMNPVFTGIFNGLGDSKTPFLINTIGLVMNIILDPLLIFGVGPLPKMGIFGAAIATVFSQFVVSLFFIRAIFRSKVGFEKMQIFRLPDIDYQKYLLKLGSPVALQSALFTTFAILIARLIAKWGPVPIAAQKVGAHIEAISWMSSEGFATAISTFVGQNFGAQKWVRIWKGYFSGLGTVSVIGLISTILLVFFGREIFSIFIPEPEAIAYGSVYLKILGLSQIFMCIEIATAGAFNGLGRTVPPSIVSIIFTGLRVPAAYILSSESILGLEGVWWSISMSSVFKGIVLLGWFLILLYKHPCIRGDQIIKSKIFKRNIRVFRDKRCIQGKM